MSGVVAENRQARYKYAILQTFEAGIELRGCEVKSIREGEISLQEGYIHVVEGDLWMEGVHVAPYEHAARTEIDPIRSRRLLMHRKEINRISADVSRERLTLIPLKVYLKRGKVKVLLGMAKGKKLHDKRAAIKDREAKRSLERVHRTRKKN